jgi:hypothetical protein
MTDDLKARLRDFNGDGYTRFCGKTLTERAADRIEALELALTQSRAETAASYERAVKAVTDAPVFSDNDTDGQSAAKVIALGRATKAIRALATHDQSAALDAVRVEARAQGMREAAQLCADDAEFARKKLGASETREEAANWALIVTRCDFHKEVILAAIKGAKPTCDVLAEIEKGEPK